MKIPLTLAAISLLSIVPACIGQQENPRGAKPHLGRILRVSASVAGGFSGGYDYKVQIDRAGNVLYTGGRGAVQGVHKAHIPPDRFRMLIRELKRQGIYQFQSPDELTPLNERVVSSVGLVGEKGSIEASSVGDPTGKATAYEELVTDAASVKAWFGGTYEVIALLDAEGFSLDKLDTDTLERIRTDAAKHKDARTAERISIILQERCGPCSSETNSTVPQ